MRKLTLPPKDIRTVEDAARAITQLHEAIDFLETERFKTYYEVLRTRDVVEILPPMGYLQYIYRINLDRSLKLQVLQSPPRGARIVFAIKDDGAGRTVDFSSNLIPSTSITLTAGETRLVDFLFYEDE